MMYRLYCSGFGQTVPNGAMTISASPQVSFIFDPANTDYQQFKTQVLADEAQLEDADGNLMTAEDAKAFVATLP